MKKAEEAECGDLNLNKTPEEMEEVLAKVDAALGKVEDELATHTEGKEKA